MSIRMDLEVADAHGLSVRCGQTEDMVKEAAAVLCHGSRLTGNQLAEALAKAQGGSSFAPEFEAWLSWVRDADTDRVRNPVRPPVRPDDRG